MCVVMTLTSLSNWRNAIRSPVTDCVRFFTSESTATRQRNVDGESCRWLTDVTWLMHVVKIYIEIVILRQCVLFRSGAWCVEKWWFSTFDSSRTNYAVSPGAIADSSLPSIQRSHVSGIVVEIFFNFRFFSHQSMSHRIRPKLR